MRLTRLLTVLDDLLLPGAFKDYCPNGLQVEGRPEVSRLATAATASQQAIEAAIEAGADALLVHHGILWGGDQRLIGPLGRRVTALAKGGCSLLAYHLPLDAHPQLGNSAIALEMLGATNEDAFGDQNLGRQGRLPSPMTLESLVERCQQAFNHSIFPCPGGPDRIQRLGVVTGGGHDWLRSAATSGLDAFITGEIVEHTWHDARELGIHCLACGHHATEDHAVHRLGARLAAEQGLDHRIIRLDAPL